MGAGALGGIGFTVSLFVTGLAFDSPALIADAKIGILIASLLAGALGTSLLLWLRPRRTVASDDLQVTDGPGLSDRAS